MCSSSSSTERRWAELQDFIYNIFKHSNKDTDTHKHRHLIRFKSHIFGPGEHWGWVELFKRAYMKIQLWYWEFVINYMIYLKENTHTAHTHTHTHILTIAIYELRDTHTKDPFLVCIMHNVLYIYIIQIDKAYFRSFGKCTYPTWNTIFFYTSIYLAK